MQMVTRINKTPATAFGFLAMSAVVLVAASASSAQAAEFVPHGESFSALATDSVLEFGGQSIECQQVSIAGNVSAEGGPAHLSSVQFGSPGPGENCATSIGEWSSITTAPFPNPGWDLKAISANEAGDGTAEVTIPAEGSIVLKSSLFGITICTMRIVGPQHVGATLSGQNLLVGNRRSPADANNVAFTMEGESCPFPTSGTGTLSATYRISSANPIEIE